MFKDLKHTIYSIYMCIKYPFLYPRNVFTDTHYHIYSFDQYLLKIKHKAFVDELIPLDTPDEDGNHFNHIHYVNNYFYLIYFYLLKGCYEVIQFFHCIPTYSYYDWIPKGWKKAFGKQYMDELKTQLKKDKILYKWRIQDVKEKYGTLRVYCNYGSHELYEIIDKYEDLSYNTCYFCGKPVYKISEGYILPYCKDCWEKEFGKEEEDLS